MTRLPFERRGEKIDVRVPWVLLFSTPFMIWQMGVVYFSGTTMSFAGGTPIELAEGDTTLVILAGYLASIVAVCVAPRKTVLMGRVLLPAALVSSLALFAPLPLEVATAVFFVEAFVCVFMIGAMASLAAHLLTLETVWRDGVCSVLVGGVAIALLHNGAVPVGFEVFNALSALLIALLAVFYFGIPSPVTVSFASRADRRSGHARRLVCALWFVVALSALLVCLANSYAEQVPFGTAVLSLSSAVCAGVVLAAGKLLGRIPLRSIGLAILVPTVGFALAPLSFLIPDLRMLACALMGPMVFMAGIWLVFVTMVFEIGASRFVGAAGAAVGACMAMVHAGLLDMLRDEPMLLLGLYALVAVLLAGLYAVIEPYFAYAWKRVGEGVRGAWAGGKDGQEVASQTGDAGASVDGAGVSADEARTFSDILPPNVRLSGQERVLADLILRGYAESAICAEMNITLNTQKGYRKNLYTKLGIHSKRELFELAGGRPRL